MGKYYCDYCDVFLVSESPSVRKAHNSGRNHLTNVRDYYSSLGHDKAQNIIDEITRMYESGGTNPSRPNGDSGSGGRPGVPMNGPMSGPPAMMRGPFQGQGGGIGPSNLPPFPPAMLALMNGANPNTMINGPNGGPPPMRFAGPPIINQNSTVGHGPMPPGLGLPPPGPPQSHSFGNNMSNGTTHQSGPPNQPPALIGGMNPDRARHLGLL